MAEEETPEQPEDKPVEQSTFNKYREAFLRQQLAEMNVKEVAEVDAAISFINERADAEDGNLDDVFRQLKVRMRLDERKSYINPTPMGYTPKGWTSVGDFHAKPRPRNGEGLGRKMYQRLKNKGRI